MLYEFAYLFADVSLPDYVTLSVLALINLALMVPSQLIKASKQTDKQALRITRTPTLSYIYSLLF